MKKIGERLRLLRKKEGYTQVQLSTMLGFSKSAYSGFEYERIVPSIEKFVMLAGILHTTVQYIVTGKELSAEFEEETVAFPVRLRALREKNKLTQLQVATELGVAEVTYQRYEYGDIKPKLEKLLKLAELFGVTLDELLGRTEKEAIRMDEKNL